KPVAPTSWLDSTQAKIASAGAGIAATLLTARITISNAFFKSMNKGDTFNDLQKMRDRGELGIEGIVKPTKHNIAVPDAMERISAINTEYDKAYMARRKLLG